MKVSCLTHADLDGVVSAIILKNSIPSKSELNIQYTGYLSLLKKIQNIPTSDLVFVLDLNLEEKQAQILKERSYKKLIIFDHHDTRPSTLETLSDDNIMCIFDRSKCGAQITFDYFKKKCNIDHLKELSYLTNVYDLWQEDNIDFTKSFELNDLYWELGFDKFFEQFKNGYFLTNEHKDTIKRINKEKSIYMKKSFENFSTIHSNIMIISNPEMKHISYFPIQFPGYDYYFLLKSVSDNLIEFSFKIKNEETVKSVLDKIREYIPDFNMGGHHKVGGFQLQINKIDHFFDKFVEIFEKNR